jgi:hypothetical protein
MEDLSKFKDSSNRWLKKGLFHEYATEPTGAIYHIEDAKQLYMACRDITGYEFATRHLGGWQHWKAMKASPFMEPILKEWEEELEVSLRSEAIKQIVKTSETDKGYQAAKYLADRGWAIRSAGKPSKQEVQREARVESKMYSEFDKVVKIK